MTASERSLLGFAQQTAKGTPQTTNGNFDYILFTRGMAGVQPTIVPLDPEVGGGAMLRDVIKAGAVAAGQLEFIPRPDTLGLLVKGALGTVVTTAVPATTGAYSHAFTLTPTAVNQFEAPYYTVRMAPGGMWGEQFQDARFNALTLNWRAANFVRGAFGFLGGQSSKVDPAAWAAVPDSTPPFITPTATVELPDGTAIKTLSGAVSMGMAIPLEEQWIVGAYFPDDFAITQRVVSIQLVLKIDNDDLYTQMTYDPAGGNSWVASIMREARVDINFQGNYPIAGAAPVTPYSLRIQANQQAGSAGNVVWSAQPIALRPGSQVLMAVTGTFVNDNTNAPVAVTLVNGTASYADPV